MSPSIADLTAQVLSLPIAERLQLAGKILSSLPPDVDRHIEAAWLDEAEERWQDYLSGMSAASPANEVFQRIVARPS